MTGPSVRFRESCCNRTPPHLSLDRLQRLVPGQEQFVVLLVRLELAGGSTETVQIRFQTDTSGYHELRRVLEIIVPSRLLRVEP